MYIPRRDILKGALTIAGSLLINSRAYSAGTTQDSLTELMQTVGQWSNGMPPLFCTAYIDPYISAQKGQEAIVAKYPLAIVAQDNRKEYIAWRNRIRNLNPNIKLFAYQMVIEETTAPGPGNDILRSVDKQDVWVTYPGGIIPTIKWDGADYSIRDPRSKVWQQSFLNACETTFKSYPFDGLFLDNCTVYQVASLLPGVRDEMLDALRATLTELRKRLPNVPIIGNSSYHFSPLNGALNENRPSELAAEAANRTHAQPILNLYQWISSTAQPSESDLLSNLALALKNKCYYGVAAPNYQRAVWPPLFDQVVAAYKKSPPKTIEPFNIQIVK